MVEPKRLVNFVIKLITTITLHNISYQHTLSIRMKIFFYIIIMVNITLCNYKVYILQPRSLTDKIDPNDLNSIHLLFKDAFKEYSDWNILENKNDKTCDNMDCAKLISFDVGSNKIVFGNILTLGTKIIFSATIMDTDGSNVFKNTITSLSILDMENAVKKLAKSLINRKTLDESTDVDNITAEETLEPERRKSLAKIGGFLGYTYPIDNSYDYGFIQPKRLFTFGGTSLWEYKNNYMLGGDISLSIASDVTDFGAEFEIFRLINRNDFTPFFGGGLGIHTISWSDSTIFNGNENNFNQDGLTLNLQAGVILFRTYDVNLLIRCQYHYIFNDYNNRSIGINAMIIKKLEPSTRIIHQRSYLEIFLDVFLGK